MNEQMKNLAKKMNEMKEKTKKLQDNVATLKVQGESGGGLVKVVLNGRHDVTKVQIDDSLLKGKKEILEELVAAAVNDAVRKIESKGRELMSKMAESIDMPDFKLPMQ